MGEMLHFISAALLRTLTVVSADSAAGNRAQLN